MCSRKKNDTRNKSGNNLTIFANLIKMEITFHYFFVFKLFKSVKSPFP